MNISVCMATYNGAVFIREQLNSILSQLLPGDEIVIADDGSTDDTLDILRSFPGPIRVVAESRVGGVVKNFERVIASATGEALVLCDQDDVWLPGRLDHFREKLKLNDLVILNGELIDLNGAILSKSVFDLVEVKAGFLANLYKNSFIGCCMGFRAELRENLLPFPANLPWHDWYIGLFAELARKKVYRSKEISFYYRRHGYNASSTGGSSRNSFIKKLNMRLSVLCALALVLYRFLLGAVFPVRRIHP